MRLLFGFLIVALLIGPAAAQEQSKLIGHYSNMVIDGGDDPHFLSGYRLSLYQKNRHAYGKLEVSNGSEEALGAQLQAVVFNASTKRLTFRAEFSTGWEPDENPDPQAAEAQPVVRFAGAIEGRKVVGWITIRDKNCAVCKTRTSKVVLRRTADTYVIGELQSR